MDKDELTIEQFAKYRTARELIELVEKYLENKNKDTM